MSEDCIIPKRSADLILKIHVWSSEFIGLFDSRPEILIPMLLAHSDLNTATSMHVYTSLMLNFSTEEDINKFAWRSSLVLGLLFILYTTYMDGPSLLLEYPILFILCWLFFALFLFPWVLVAMCVYAFLLYRGLAILKGIFWMVIITSALYFVSIIF